MKANNTASLTIIQMNDTHAYFDVHQEMREYLAKHQIVSAELRGTFVEV